MSIVITAKIICMHCKRLLRTEKWQMSEWSRPELEAVSHGLCDECREKYYPKKEKEK